MKKRKKEKRKNEKMKNMMKKMKNWKNEKKRNKKRKGTLFPVRNCGVYGGAQSCLIAFDREWARFWLDFTLGGLAVGRRLARSYGGPRAGSASSRRQLCQGSGFSTAQSAAARLNGPDGTLQLISTTLLANPGHLRPDGRSRKSGQAEPTFGVHRVFSPKSCFLQHSVNRYTCLTPHFHVHSHCTVQTTSVPWLKFEFHASWFILRLTVH